jgi:1-deoxy-D-xylulose-5-phosphate reductoisomerase
MSQVVEETLIHLDSKGGHIDDKMTLDNVLHVDHLARKSAEKITKQRAG